LALEQGVRLIVLIEGFNIMLVFSIDLLFCDKMPNCFEQIIFGFDSTYCSFMRDSLKVHWKKSKLVKRCFRRSDCVNAGRSVNGK
jgi:hypothetical protein